VATKAKLFAQPRFVSPQSLERAPDRLAVDHDGKCGAALFGANADIARRQRTRFRLRHDTQLTGRLQDGEFHIRHIRVALFPQLGQKIVNGVPDAPHLPIADAAMRDQNRRFTFNPVAKTVAFHLEEGDRKLKKHERSDGNGHFPDRNPPILHRQRR